MSKFIFGIISFLFVSLVICGVTSTFVESVSQATNSQSNLISSLIQAITTKEISTDVFDRLSESDKRKIIDAGVMKR